MSVLCYSWIWKTINGVKTCVAQEITLIIKVQVVEQRAVHITTRTLGVWFQPNLLWNDEFKQVRNKLIVSIKKIMNTKLHTYQIHTYFHVYMLTLVNFGCSVVQFTYLEEAELIRIYDRPIIDKFGLGEKIPR